MWVASLPLASPFSNPEPNGGPRGRGWGRGRAKQSGEKTSRFVDRSKKRLRSPPLPSVQSNYSSSQPGSIRAPVGAVYLEQLLSPLPSPTDPGGAGLEAPAPGGGVSASTGGTPKPPSSGSSLSLPCPSPVSLPAPSITPASPKNHCTPGGSPRRRRGLGMGPFHRSENQGCQRTGQGAGLGKRSRGSSLGCTHGTSQQPHTAVPLLRPPLPR